VKLPLGFKRLNVQIARCSYRSVTTYKTTQKTKITVGLACLKTKVLRKIGPYRPTGGDVTHRRKIMHNALHSLQPSLDITTSRTIRLAGYVARMGQMRNRKAWSKKGTLEPQA
jgi:hypothetical protein